MIVNKAERDVFLKLSGFFHDSADVGNLTVSEVDMGKGLRTRAFQEEGPASARA